MERTTGAVVADIGGTKLLLRAVAADGVVLAERRLPTGPETTGPDLDGAIAEFVAASGVRSSVAGASAVVPLAVAVPGLVDPDGVVVVSDVLPRLAGWTPAAPPGTGLVRVVNDVRASLAAVRADRSDDDVLVVVVGTGIAAVVLSGGTIIEGVAGWAGELGSLPVDLSGRTPGRLDDVASGRAVVEALDGDGAEVAVRLRDRDPDAVRVVATAGAALGRAVGALVNLLDPGLVVLAGGTTRHPGYVEAALTTAARAALPEVWEHTRVVVDSDPGTLVVRGLTALVGRPRSCV